MSKPTREHIRRFFWIGRKLGSVTTKSQTDQRKCGKSLSGHFMRRRYRGIGGWHSICSKCGVCARGHR